MKDLYSYQNKPMGQASQYDVRDNVRREVVYNGAEYTHRDAEQQDGLPSEVVRQHRQDDSDSRAPGGQDETEKLHAALLMANQTKLEAEE